MRHQLQAMPCSVLPSKNHPVPDGYHIAPRPPKELGQGSKALGVTYHCDGNDRCSTSQSHTHNARLLDTFLVIILRYASSLVVVDCAGSIITVEHSWVAVRAWPDGSLKVCCCGGGGRVRP